MVAANAVGVSRVSEDYQRSTKCVVIYELYLGWSLLSLLFMTMTKGLHQRKYITRTKYKE